MTAFPLEATITPSQKATGWFRNPAFFNGPEFLMTAAIVPTGAGYDGGAVKLEAAIVHPDSDPNDVAPATEAIQELPEFEWNAATTPEPRNVATTLPWLRLVADGTNPSLQVWVY